MILRYQIEFQSYWHIGSGLGRGNDLDAIVARDELGLPLVRARTLKGLWRDAGRLVEQFGETPVELAKWFGVENAGQGTLIVNDARIDEGTRHWLAGREPDEREELASYLFDRIAATRLNGGVAMAETLRVREVAVPLRLTATIEGPDDDADWPTFLRTAGRLVRKIGVGRHRGMGRCGILFAKEGTQ